MGKRKTTKYSEDFKREAVRQTTERGYTVVEVAKRLGVSTKTLYGWRYKYADEREAITGRPDRDSQMEINKLKAELRRMTEERDILKKAAAYFAKQSP